MEGAARCLRAEVSTGGFGPCDRKPGTSRKVAVVGQGEDRHPCRSPRHEGSVLGGFGVVTSQESSARQSSTLC